MIMYKRVEARKKTGDGAKHKGNVFVLCYEKNCKQKGICASIFWCLEPGLGAVFAKLEEDVNDEQRVYHMDEAEC